MAWAVLPPAVLPSGAHERAKGRAQAEQLVKADERQQAFSDRVNELADKVNAAFGLSG